MYKFRAAHANRKRRHCRYGRPKEKYGACLPPALSYTIMCLSGTPIGAVDPGSGEGGSSRADH